MKKISILILTIFLFAGCNNVDEILSNLKNIIPNQDTKEEGEFIKEETEIKTDNSLEELNLEDLEYEIIPITKPEIKPPPPPPPPPPPQPEVIEVVEDDVEIEEEIAIEETKTDEEEDFEIPEEEDDDEIFMVVEQAPEFPCMKFGRKEYCGYEALNKYLQKNVNYPAIAKEYAIEGRVYVQFVVEKNGKITNVKLRRGVDKSLEEEALRVVKSFPDWNPGKQRGKAVRTYFTVPINFNLN